MVSWIWYTPELFQLTFNFFYNKWLWALCLLCVHVQVPSKIDIYYNWDRYRPWTCLLREPTPYAIRYKAKWSHFGDCLFRRVLPLFSGAPGFLFIFIQLIFRILHIPNCPIFHLQPNFRKSHPTNMLRCFNFALPWITLFRGHHIFNRCVLLNLSMCIFFGVIY